MKLEVLRISEVTSTGNALISLGEKMIEHVKGLGDIVSRKTRFLVAVDAKTLEVEVGDSIDLDIDKYDVVERTWEDEEGDEVTTTWLVLKQGK